MSESILKFWDEQAVKYGEDSLATMPDTLLKELEIENISKYLPDSGLVADIGCGNGFSTYKYCERNNCQYVGYDFSSEMIQAAKKAQEMSEFSERTHFSEASILNLPDQEAVFDAIITDRCLINLTSRLDQEKAVSEVYRVLKPGGLYLMCEDTEQGLSNLNTLRRISELDEIGVRWHNLYLDESHIKSTFDGKFELLEEVKFSSCYYILSRIANACLARDCGQDPDYLSPINKIARTISSLGDFGDFGPLKLYVLKKI